MNSILAAGVSRKVSRAGTATGTPRVKAVPVPPSSHLALLCTVTVHPQYTTRVEKKDHLDAASAALSYLRNLLVIVGPLNADFRTAFQFFQNTTRGGRRSVRDNLMTGTDAYSNELSDGDDDRANEDRVRGKLANEGSVWRRGQNFWSVLGWAFNCSVLHPQRWRYWRTWLGFMLDVMDADWEERDRRDSEAHEANGRVGDVPTTSRRDSIIYMYMNQQSGRQGTFKAMVKAILADGSAVSAAAFREIFEKEPRAAKKRSNKRKREVVDIENDKFGDYYDDESFSSGVSEPPTPEKAQKQHSSRPSTHKSQDTCFGAENPWYSESMTLRLRVFKLLSLATATLGKPRDLQELYEDFIDGLKLLSPAMFSLLLTQRANPLRPETHATIIKGLFDLLLPSSHKRAHKVDPEADAQGLLTKEMLEQCYVIHAANTVALEDNAKLSLVVENAIHLLWQCGGLVYAESLAKAVEKGIEARAAKGKKKRTHKARPEPSEALAQDILNDSADRIRLMMEAMMLDGDAEEEELEVCM